MEVKEFKYLGTMLCKHGNTEGEISERERQTDILGTKNTAIGWHHISNPLIRRHCLTITYDCIIIWYDTD